MPGSGRAGLRGETALRRDIVALRLSRLNLLLDRRSSERYAAKALSVQAASLNADLDFISKSGKLQHAHLYYTAAPDRTAALASHIMQVCHRLRGAETHLPNQHK